MSESECALVFVKGCYIVGWIVYVHTEINLPRLFFLIKCFSVNTINTKIRMYKCQQRGFMGSCECVCVCVNVNSNKLFGTSLRLPLQHGVFSVLYPQKNFLQ